MWGNSVKNLVRNLVGRELVKSALRPLLSWHRLDRPAPGYSIVLGVPWDLRHLLPVNLRFVAATDRSRLDRIHVVFDRTRRKGMEAIEAEAVACFPDLPLRFHHYPKLAGSVVDAVNVSTFYNSMNCAVALGAVRTRYAVMHDFDLYPRVADYFEAVVRRMEIDRLKFCGLERTNHDGILDSDDVLGTWCLGVDVEWLRASYSPIHIFHKLVRLRGKWTTLDPFSWIQLRTPERALVGSMDGSAACHVKNLCATYLRYRSGERVRVAWKLHYLWYLEAVNGADRLDAISSRMDASSDGMLATDTRNTEDFRQVDPTCANVLEREIEAMDVFLFGQCRPHVRRYLESFRAFLDRAAASLSRNDGAGS